MMNLTITCDNTGDHPLYNFQLLSADGKHRIEQSLRFAACRNFHQEFIVPCKVGKSDGIYRSLETDNKLSPVHIHVLYYI